MVTSTGSSRSSAQPIFASPSSSSFSSNYPYFSSYSHNHNNVNNHRNRLVSPRHLRIRAPTIADLGTYICVANNSHFEVRHETDLLLKTMLQVNLTSDVPANTPLLPGDSVTLTCNVSSTLGSYFEDSSLPSSLFNSRLQITYHWYHNLVPVFESHGRVTSSSLSSSRGGGNSHGYGFGGSTSSSSSAHLLSPNVLRLADLRYTDGGVYQCAVRISSAPDYEQWLPTTAVVVSLRSAPPILVATFTEQILLAEGALSLRCSATGVPAPLIIWQRNGLNLTDTEGNLVMTAISGGSGSHYRYKTASRRMRSRRFGGSKKGDNQDDGDVEEVTGSSEHTRLLGTVSYFNITAIRAQVGALFYFKQKIILISKFLVKFEF